MRALRRWTASIAASFDGVITQFENHEALVSSAIREVKHTAAKARVQLDRVKRDGQALRKRLSELRENELLWKDRALRVQETDEKKALECLRRRKRAQREIHDLEEQERKHAKLEQQLNMDLQTLEERVQELRRQKHILSTRQYRAEALRVVKSEGTGIIADIDELFDRWETKVAEYELYSNCDCVVDDRLEEELSTEEEEAELQAELRQIINQENKANEIR